jgi:tetratricopeptide (TPR) repeat protein/serine/threonine protein kinase
MPVDAQRVQAVFLLTVEAANPAARAAALERECGSDAELRQRVEALLRAHDGPGDLLGQPAMQSAATIDAPRPAEGPGSRIGQYKLLQQIGEGGMGTVFMAEQAEPVRRHVALKVIKPGMDTRQVVARFDAERQALAMMDHPNIARVFDAGTTDSGLPYFVMELIKGVPITKYCDAHRLTPRQRMELFVPVCQAVQHAHQKGIIHRDLKPSNVLIALYDGKPVAKVIDFGVAKAIGGGLTDKTLFTDFGSVVGTLEYMSPEQAEPNQLDIDTRSDLYSLGVLLYELLTGTTPFERKRLRAAALLECLRIIREEEPPKPSTRLSTAEQLPTVAANRGLEPKKLTGVVRGDLDWIVMKCLEKDRNRRYETANGLAMDVQRYLADEPVLACPPSPLYRLRKFSRRHKTGLLTTMAAMLVLGLAAGGIGWGLWDRAAQDAARRVDLAGRLANTERAVIPAVAKAEQLSDQATDMTVASSKEAAAALVVWQQASDALRQAEAALSTGVPDDRLGQQIENVRGRIAEGQAQTERQRTRAARNEKLFRDLDDARMAMASVKESQLDYAGAAAKYAAAFAAFGLDFQPGQTAVLAQRIRTEEPAVRDALLVALHHWAFYDPTPRKADLWAVVLVADHDWWRRDYRQAAVDLDGAALVRLSNEARRLSLPPASFQLLAQALHDTDRRDKALDLLRWARGCHPNDFWIAYDLGNYLGHAKELIPVDLGHTKALSPVDLEEQIGCFRVAVALRPDASPAHLNLGIALAGKNLLDDAIAEYKTAIALDPRYAQAHNNLGNALKAKNQLDDAIAEFNQAIAVDPKLAAPHNNLGNALLDKHQVDEAIAEFKKAVALDPNYALFTNNLGNALQVKNQLDDAIAEYKKAIALDPKYAPAHYNLGRALRAKNQLDDAIAEYRTAIALDSNHALAHVNLGVALADMKRFDDAIAEYHKAITLAPKDPLAHYNLGIALRDKNQLDDAIVEFKKAIALGSKRVEVYSNLGNALKARNQLDDAIAAYEMGIAVDSKSAQAHVNLGLALQAKNRLDDAIAAFNKAIALDSKDAAGHTNLGIALASKHRLDDAIVAFNNAIARNAKDAKAHYNLGNALVATNRMDDAIAAYRKAVALDSKIPEAHLNLALTLCAKNQLDDSIGEFNKAIALNPKSAPAHGALGQALLGKGRFMEARANLQKALDLLSEKNRLRPVVLGLRNQCDTWLALEMHMTDVLAGKLQPKDNRQRLDFIEICRRQQRHAAAAKFYDDAFAADARLADNRNAFHRYNAACFASLAAAGKGSDGGDLDNKERTRLRKQSIMWLRADLDLLAKRLEDSKPADRKVMHVTLRHWQEDTDLAGIRDNDALGRLPADEREACRKLWTTVAELLKKSGSAK